MAVRHNNKDSFLMCKNCYHEKCAFSDEGYNLYKTCFLLYSNRRFLYKKEEILKNLPQIICVFIRCRS